jgi:hypothetical protein
MIRASFAWWVAILGLAACQRTEERAIDETPATAAGSKVARDLSCEDAYAVDTPIGRLTNNVWNKQAAGGAPYKQCLRTRGEEVRREYGWSWDWPVHSTTLLAYPQTIFGWKPWNGGSSSHERLPIRLLDVQSFRLDYSVEIDAHGKHNLATALWLTRSGRTSADPNPADISADVNIWSEGFEFDPLGTKIGEVSIDGTTFEIWHAADMGDASAANSNRWTHVVYRAKVAQHSASLDIKKFLDDALARKLISAEHFVSSIELGNEVMSGSGETWIRSLRLDVR